MKKANIVLIAILISIAISGLWVFVNRQSLLFNPFDVTLNIESVTRIEHGGYKRTVHTGGDSVYIVYDSLQKIVKLSENGDVEFILRGNTGKQGSFSKAWDVCATEEGTLFVLDTILDESGIKVSEEAIRMYDSDGLFVKNVFSRKYSDEEKPDLEGNFRKIKYMGNAVYYYYLDKEKLQIGRIDPDTSQDSVLFTMKQDNPKLNILDCDFNEDISVMAFLTRKGQIFSGGRGADPVQLYTSSEFTGAGGRSIPWQISISGKYLYFSDLGKMTIDRLALDTPVENHISSSLFPDVITSFKIKNDKFIAVTNSAMYEGDFFGRNVERSEAKRFSTDIIIERSILFFAEVWLILSVIAFLAWIFVVGMKARVSDVLMQSLMIIGVTVIAASVVINIAISALTTIYKQNLFDNLKYINQLSMKNINGDLFEKLKNREDFMSPDYVELRTQLHSLFNDNNDEWNSDFYGCFYVKEGNRVYVSLFYDDSSGLYFPYKDNYKGTPFEKVFDKGEYAAIEESDIYGSWLYSLGPIYNSKGEVVAALEVGRDLYTFNEMIQKLVTDLNKEIVTLLVILVLFMIEIAIVRNVFKHKLDSPGPLGRYSVEIVRMLAFLIALAYSFPVSYTPLMMRKILTDSGVTFLNLPVEIAMAIPISAEMLATAVFSVVAGGLIEKRGWKLPFMAGTVCMIAGSLIAFMFKDPYLFVAGRTLVGVCYGFVLVALQCYPMASADVEERNSGIASQQSGLNAGYCCGVAIGGLLADNLGFFKVYLFAVVVALLAMIFSGAFMKNAFTYAKKDEAAARVRASDVFSFFRDKNIFLFFFTAFIPVSIIGMFMTYQYPIYAESQGISAGDISRVFMMNCLVIIYLGPPLVRFLSKRRVTRGKWAMVIYLLVSATGLFVFGLTPGTLTAVLVVLLIGVGDSFGLPMSNDFIIGQKAAMRIGFDKSIGYLNFIGNIGMMIGPILLGYLFSIGYRNGMMYLMGGIIIALIVFMIFARDEVKPAGEVVTDEPVL